MFQERLHSEYFRCFTLSSTVSHRLIRPLLCLSQILEQVQRQKKEEMARRALERQLKAEEKREKAEQMKRMQVGLLAGLFLAVGQGVLGVSLERNKVGLRATSAVSHGPVALLWRSLSTYIILPAPSLCKFGCFHS
jgi:hypothetical protein